MCGRYVQAKTGPELAQMLRADVVGRNVPLPSWNVKPTEQVPVFIESRKVAGERRLESARWALTPPWSKTLETRSPHFNARIETVLENRTFSAAARQRRCVLPADGYYEWTGVKGAKVPHYIHLDEPILFAGLASWWQDTSRAQPSWHLTCTMLTMDSYGPMQDIHHRIPVFVTSDFMSDWLSPEVTGDEELFGAVTEATRSIGGQLREHAVAPLRGDGPGLIEPVTAS